jgi:hypothetical protein
MCVVFAVSFDVTGNDFDFQILWFFWNCFLFFLSPFAQSFFPRTTSPGTSLTDIWIKLVFLSIYIWVVSRNTDERSCDWLYTTDSFSFVRFIWRGVASILTVTLCFFLFYSREKIMMMLHNSTYIKTLSFQIISSWNTTRHFSLCLPFGRVYNWHVCVDYLWPSTRNTPGKS